MTNPMRGQTQIELAGQTFNARLTIDALITLETALDKGILQITQDLSNADVRLSEISHILLHALRGGGNDFDEKKVKQLITETGIVQSTKQVADLLVGILNDPDSEDDESAKKD